MAFVWMMAVILPDTVAAETLRWKMEAGDRFAVELNHSTKLLNDTVEIPHDTKLWFTWTVDGVEKDGTFHLTQTIDRIAVMIGLPGRDKLNYDSSEEGETEELLQTVSTMMKPLVGVKLRQKMNDRGKILELAVPDKALTAIQNNPLIKKMLPNDSVKNVFSNIFPEFPAAAINEGDDWSTDEESRSALGNMGLSSTFTYRGQKNLGGRQLHRVEVSTDITLLNEPHAETGADLDLREQESTGTIHFDNQAGHLVDLCIHQKMTIDLMVFGRPVTQKIETTQQLTMRSDKVAGSLVDSRADRVAD
ncbi:MAG: hypothetical protein CMJ62_01330 [Planctomycetaceae bacterium]|nr:hypothetical protein [Planctomycetaceae bacterium]